MEVKNARIINLKPIFFFLICVFFGSGSFSQSYNSVNAWLNDLSSNEKLKRDAAALGLDSITGDMEAEYKLLLNALNNPNPFVRRYVCYTLGTLQYKPATSIPRLIYKFRDDDIKVRQYACVAAAMYGNKAINYLLDSLQTNKGFLDEDGPGNYISDEDSALYKKKGGIFKSGSKGTYGEYYLTRTSFYCMFCLRMLDEKKIREASKTKTGIPPVIKSVINNNNNDDKSYENVIYSDSEPRPFVLPVSASDTIGLAKEVTRLLTTVDSPIIIKHKRPKGKIEEEVIFVDSSKGKGLFILMNYPYLVKFIDPKLLLKHAEFISLELSILANSGQYGIDYLPVLKTLMRDTNTVIKWKAFLATGYILTDNYGVYKLADTTRIFDLRRLAFLSSYCEISDPFLFQEITPFYKINFAGLSKEEKDIATYVKATDCFDISDNLDDFNSKFIVEERMTKNSVLNESLLKHLISEGMNDEDVIIKTMAIHFSKAIANFDANLEERIKSFLESENYFIQEAAVDVALDKKILPDFSQNISELLVINRLIIERFHSEQRIIFGGEGTPGLGAWGAGGSGGVAPAVSFWPPPPGSCRGTIDITNLYASGTLKEIKSKLTGYLQQAGFQPDFYRIFEKDRGFIIMTRSEKTNDKGEVVKEKRWSKETTGSFFSILSSGNVGYWRTITFIVTPVPDFQDNGSPFRTIQNNETIYNTGGFNLSPALQSASCRNYYVHVIIYHYYQKNGGVTRQINSSENELSVFDHLNSLKIPSKF